MGCVFMLKYLEDPETRQRRIQNFQYITNIGIESCLQILENLAEVPRPSQMAFVNNLEENMKLCICTPPYYKTQEKHSIL